MEQEQKKSSTKMLIAYITAIVFFVGGAAGLALLRNWIFLIAVLLGIVSVILALVWSKPFMTHFGQDAVKKAARVKADSSLLKYYLIMGGILAAEIGLLYLIYLFQTTAKWLYVLFAFLIFLGIVAFLVGIRVKEKAKIKPVSEILGGYLRVASWTTAILFGLFVVLIIIKSVSLIAYFG